MMNVDDTTHRDGNVLLMERGLGDGLCFVGQANCESCQDQTDQRPEQEN